MNHGNSSSIFGVGSDQMRKLKSLIITLLIFTSISVIFHQSEEWTKSDGQVNGTNVCSTNQHNIESWMTNTFPGDDRLIQTDMTRDEPIAISDAELTVSCVYDDYILSSNTETNTDGFYNMDVHPGSYSGATITRDGYYTKSIIDDFDLDSGESYWMNGTMNAELRTVPLDLTIMNSDTGKTLDQLSVTIIVTYPWGYEGASDNMLFENVDGDISTEVSPGYLSVYAYREGYQQGELYSEEVNDGDSITKDIFLDPINEKDIQISGVVKDDAGEAMEGVTVQYNGSDGGKETITSDANGEFETVMKYIEISPDYYYTSIDLQKDGYYTLSYGDLSDSPGDSRDLSFTLTEVYPNNFTLRIHVYDSESFSDLDDANVYVGWSKLEMRPDYSFSSHTETNIYRTDRNGRVEVEMPIPDSISVMAYCDDYIIGDSIFVSDPAGDSLEMEMPLEPYPERDAVIMGYIHLESGDQDEDDTGDDDTSGDDDSSGDDDVGGDDDSSGNDDVGDDDNNWDNNTKSGPVVNPSDGGGSSTLNVVIIAIALLTMLIILVFTALFMEMRKKKRKRGRMGRNRHRINERGNNWYSSMGAIPPMQMPVKRDGPTYPCRECGMALRFVNKDGMWWCDGCGKFVGKRAVRPPRIPLNQDGMGPFPR